MGVDVRLITQEPLVIGDTPLQVKGSYFGLKNAVVCLSVGVGHC